MSFLPDVVAPCEACGGLRFDAATLAVLWQGRSVGELLQTTASDAARLFAAHPAIARPLAVLDELGVGYLQLGQPSNTLSGGEAQRLKLAAHLSATRRGRSLFILDEPTTGLHFQDVVQLLDCFDALINVGHSLIVVEHNLQLMKAADYIVDLGPGAADEGGRVVAQGTPEALARVKESITGRFLAQALAEEQRAAQQRLVSIGEED